MHSVSFELSLNRSGVILMSIAHEEFTAVFGRALNSARSLISATHIVMLYCTCTFAKKKLFSFYIANIT